MTSSNRPTEDQYEVALAVRCLVRLRHHQGRSGVEEDVKEAAGLEWRFCANCGTEAPHEGDLCTGCGLNADRRLGRAMRGFGFREVNRS